ncbi:MAG TPA: ribosome maturation factor RimM [Alphaproteobacteria bacterium]
MAHICLGQITGAHGIRGEVRVRSFTARAEDVAAYGTLADETGTRNFALKVTGMARGAVRARIDGVADRNAAEALKGTRLFVDRDKLPEPEADEFYQADLVGLAARRADGTPVGRIVAVQNFGAGDALEIAPDAGGTFYVPFTADAVPEVDIAGGRVVVTESFAFRQAQRERKPTVRPELVEERTARVAR